MTSLRTCSRWRERSAQTGMVVSSEVPPVDLRLLEFTHDLLRVQAEGGDVHARVFGFATDRAL